MAEYVLQPDDDPAEVARALLDKAASPDGVHWSPRPDVPRGGVFVVNDEETVAAVTRERGEARRIEAERIAEAQQAADQRDELADETGLTPLELGIPANQGTDPGSAAEAERNAELTAEDADEDEPVVEDDPATPEDESKLTPAAARRARREAKAKADADAPAEEEGK